MTLSVANLVAMVVVPAPGYAQEVSTSQPILRLPGSKQMLPGNGAGNGSDRTKGAGERSGAGSSSSFGSVFDISGDSPASSADADPNAIRGRVQMPNLLDGDARWTKDHRLGVEALRQHQFAKAEELLQKAVREAKRKISKHDELIETRLVLARLYLKQERFHEAESIYDQNLGKIESHFGSESKEYVEAEIGLARCLVAFGKEKAALVHVKKAVRILEKKRDTDSKLFGYALETLALIDAGNAWYEDARPLFNEALKIFIKEPGYKSLDLAEILREQALFYHRRGERDLAFQLYEESYKIKERAIRVAEPASLSGQVRFVWEPGSTRAKEIIDTEFPFRYLQAGSVRVAATVIDLWELLGVLITVTNVSDHQQEFELGKATLLELNSEGGHMVPNEVAPVDPKSIDRIRRERVMWDLTHTRPWLANIQKTRTVRGLVPPYGHDLFRGPNVFGVYREWKAVSHIVPARVSVHDSREGLPGAPGGGGVTLPGLLREGGHSVQDHVPVFLEPFESRTGDLFYLNPRDKDVVLKVPVGNAVFEIPFHTRKLKIP
jgi:tetratricopeptide (TPR) repeat protein